MAPQPVTELYCGRLGLCSVMKVKLKMESVGPDRRMTTVRSDERHLRAAPLDEY